MERVLKPPLLATSGSSLPHRGSVAEATGFASSNDYLGVACRLLPPNPLGLVLIFSDILYDNHFRCWQWRWHLSHLAPSELPGKVSLNLGRWDLLVIHEQRISLAVLYSNHYLTRLYERVEKKETYTVTYICSCRLSITNPIFLDTLSFGFF